ncbi:MULTISPECIES: ATP-dependent Clp protease proteolytic subunit [Enterobacter cloacae complex]|uniref:ATP-dependent Clp protease proteolytic subunit n=1 Tax=Enterobacter cloacae complex TaxID=354276 RepID=UPI000287D56D|nr:MULTISPECIES: ATP-dependent Clp protease proteolytic subunit [Enterobacter cloacae complex]EJO47779.1 Clp protease [Enterobacter sp. SST3]MCK7050150.1 ATP-dependent Clp protease proteolytic subunit [Enterobacter roggenkampii]POT97549.1 Clp protease [Enterobacter cloacae complex sp. ECNIH14]WFX56881.1 ATP-dependent Clp protease proteolytic subunit [Enterobacter roggenkampii]
MLHTLMFTCPVNQSTVNALIGNCLGAINQGATELNIYISSQGGDLVAGFTAYHFLKALPVPVRTHNLSNVESVANIIFLAGSERKANPGSRFLLHPFHWGLAGPSVDHSRVSEWTACLNNDLERFVDVIEASVGSSKNRDEWKKIISAATIADAAMASDWGLIHDITVAGYPLAPGTYWWINC